MGHRPQWHLREPTMDTYIRKGAARTVAEGALAVLMALITPLLEKNPAKALATQRAPSCFRRSAATICFSEVMKDRSLAGRRA